MTTKHCYQINGESVSDIILFITNMMQYNGILNNLVDFHENVMFVRGEFRGNFTHLSRFFRAKDFYDFDGFSQNQKNVCQRCTKFLGNQ